MDLNLQPLGSVSVVSNQPFEAGQRVMSILIRDPAQPEVLRFDLLESERGQFTPPGPVACRWVHVFKPRKAGENPERELKLTAESLFLTLVDPASELTVENVRLVQFLALMLERKKVLRPKGVNGAGTHTVFEHAKTKELVEVPVGELTPDFFIQVQTQLSVLVGEPKPKPEPGAAAPAVAKKR